MSAPLNRPVARRPDFAPVTPAAIAHALDVQPALISAPTTTLADLLGFSAGGPMFRRPLFEVLSDSAQLCMCDDVRGDGVRFADATESGVCSDTDAMRVTGDGYDSGLVLL